MSETVKLIIEIPKELHEALLNGYEEPYSRMFSDVVKNGIPLDDLKEKIAKLRLVGYADALGKFAIASNAVMDVLDSIGEADFPQAKDIEPTVESFKRTMDNIEKFLP